MSTSTLDKARAELAKDAEIHQTVEAALKNLEEHAGQEGFRHSYDKAIHVLAAIHQAGFSIVRKRSKSRT